MNDEEGDGFFMGLSIGSFMGIVFTAIIAVIAVTGRQNDLREEGIKAGVAKWTINETSGEEKFVFFNPPDDKTGPITKEEIENRR